MNLASRERGKDFAAWYQDVVLSGDMAEPAEIVKGLHGHPPQRLTRFGKCCSANWDTRFKTTGHQNVLFPAADPAKFSAKRGRTRRRFLAGAVAVVTHAGGKELEEPYVIRPTSETIIGHFFAQVDSKLPRPCPC